MRGADIAAALWARPSVCYFLRLFHFAAGNRAAARHAPCLPTKAAGIPGRIPRSEIVNNSRFFTEECGGSACRRLPSCTAYLGGRPALCAASAFLVSIYLSAHVCVFICICMQTGSRTDNYYECKRPARKAIWYQTHVYYCIARTCDCSARSFTGNFVGGTFGC